MNCSFYLQVGYTSWHQDVSNQFLDCQSVGFFPRRWSACSVGLFGNSLRDKWHLQVVAVGQMAGNYFLHVACEGGHFMVGNKLPACNFFHPSRCRGCRDNVTLFCNTIRIDCCLPCVPVSSNARSFISCQWRVKRATLQSENNYLLSIVSFLCNAKHDGETFHSFTTRSAPIEASTKSLEAPTAT